MRDLRQVPSRFRDAQKQGHEVGVGHHSLAVLVAESSDRRVESAARGIQRGLRMNHRRRAETRVHEGEPRRDATHMRPDQTSPHVMPMNNAMPTSAII